MAISITKPTVGGSEDTWGATINTALDTIVNGVNGTSGTIAPDLSTLTINGTDVTATAAELNILDGVTATAAELNYMDGVTSNVQTQLDAITLFPTGGIIMWSGTVAGIPSGWALCDGTNGTPNLVDRFIVGSGTDSGGTHDVDDTGGSNSLTLTESQLPSHTHSFSGTSDASSITNTSIDTVQENTGGGSITVGDNTLARVPAKNDAFDRRNVDQNIGGSHTHTFSGTTGSTGSGSSIDNRPAYYALAFIMKT